MTLSERFARNTDEQHLRSRLFKNRSNLSILMTTPGLSLVISFSLAYGIRWDRAREWIRGNCTVSHPHYNIIDTSVFILNSLIFLDVLRGFHHHWWTNKIMRVFLSLSPLVPFMSFICYLFLCRRVSLMWDNVRLDNQNEILRIQNGLIIIIDKEMRLCLYIELWPDVHRKGI